MRRRSQAWACIRVAVLWLRIRSWIAFHPVAHQGVAAVQGASREREEDRDPTTRNPAGCGACSASCRIPPLQAVAVPLPFSGVLKRESVGRNAIQEEARSAKNTDQADHQLQALCSSSTEIQKADQDSGLEATLRDNGADKRARCRGAACPAIAAAMRQPTFSAAMRTPRDPGHAPPKCTWTIPNSIQKCWPPTLSSPSRSSAWACSIPPIQRTTRSTRFRSTSAPLPLHSPACQAVYGTLIAAAERRAPPISCTR